MFERYTEGSRRSLFFSRWEASRLGSITIETEHLLCGLIREREGPIVRLFASLGVSPEALQQEVEKRVAAGLDKIPTSVEIPFSTETKRALQFGAEEANRLQSTSIGSEHLLLGLMREEGTLAASILADKGVRLANARERIVELQHVDVQAQRELTLKLSGYTTPEQQLFRNVLFDQLYASLPKDPQAKVQIYNAEIAPGGYTNWHCHNGATFFIALQGIFEAEFQEGILVRAQAGDVYSEPIAKFHRGHNPHPEVPYLCIGVCITAPDRDHVTNAIARPW
jgi:quercetin dioxygenase-like cupin family protein